jgi:lysosomal Pro-X carboxypeptidase
MQVWQGVIAGSAPIWAYKGENPPLDPGYFAKGVTYDTTQEAGAAAGCTETLRHAFAAVVSEAATGAEGLRTVTHSLSICPDRRLNSTEDAVAVRDWAGSAFDMMAMGNYPFPSGYMLNGHGELPAFPMRVACSNLMAAVAPVRRSCMHVLRRTCMLPLR